MAEPLGQVVFKVPELGKAGYELQVKKEARQEKERKERESELYRTGGEKAYSDNIYKLQGRYKKEVQLLFQELEKYGSQYEYSNDPSSLRKATEVSNRIKSVIDEYNVSVGTPLSAASRADSEGWEGYVDDRNTFNEKMYNVLNPEEIKGIKVENGQTLYQINGEWVPKESTPYGSKDPNQYNTVMVQKASNLGKYVVPSYFENENRYLSYKASSAEDAANGMVREFYFQLEENPELRADAAVAYAISLEMIPSENIPYQDMKKAIDKYQKDKLFEDEANDFYAKKLARVAANRWSTSNTSDFGPVGGEEKATEEATEGGASTEKTSNRAASIVPDEDMDLGLPPNMKENLDTEMIKNEDGSVSIRNPKAKNTTPAQEPAPVQGPPSVEDEVIRIANEVGETKLEEVPEDMETAAAMEGQSVQGKGTPEDPQSYKNRGVIPAAPKAKEGAPMPVQSKEVPTKSAKAYYTPVDDLTWTPQTVKKAMDRWNTDIPVPYEDFIYVSNKYGIPVELIIAMAAKEGNIGVGERQVKTKNFFNWGNTTAGDTLKGKEQDKYNRYFSTWRDGLEVWADGMVRLYRPEDGDWSALWSEEGAFVNKDGKRYAADKNYEKSIRDIINGSLPRQLGDNYIAAR